MKKDINYYNYHVGEGRDEYQPNNELTWNAYIEDCNSNTIKVFNIFNNFRFINGVICKSQPQIVFFRSTQNAVF